MEQSVVAKKKKKCLLLWIVHPALIEEFQCVSSAQFEQKGTQERGCLFGQRREWDGEEGVFELPLYCFSYLKKRNL